jgi:hypothetical protein
MPLHIRFSLAQGQSFDLHCANVSRRLDGSEVAALAATAEHDYFADDKHTWPAKLPQLIDLGRALHQWLDGPQGWLRSGLRNGETTLLLDLAGPAEAQDLNPATRELVQKLAHLPWELLHDGKVFLAERGVAPIRVMHSRKASTDNANRPLRLLFMATSPEDVAPVLAYENEEATILEATRDQPIHLVVEESGSVSQLENLAASFGKGYFDIFHLTGHGFLNNDTPYFVTENDHGRAEYTTVDQLAQAFGHRWPRLIFLSGCHTAQAPAAGMVPSMAHALVNSGAGAVLGWALPVYDDTGIFAATELYRALATGATLQEAVADARRNMLRTFLQQPTQPYSDWHLLRIYQASPDTPALVTPLMTKGRESPQV